MNARPAVALLAKQPLPGLSKTRLTPPFTPDQAAELAAAMLQDVAEAVTATPGIRPVLVLAGEPGAWVPADFEVILQRGESHAERIANAFADLEGPALLIGMDTPQVTPELLADSVAALVRPGVDAVLGPATDGGWWAAGFRDPLPEAFEGVPMSRPDTIDHQRRRFRQLGLDWTELAVLTDVDDASTLQQVAASIPASHLARGLERMNTDPVAAR